MRQFHVLGFEYHGSDFWLESWGRGTKAPFVNFCGTGNFYSSKVSVRWISRYLGFDDSEKLGKWWNGEIWPNNPHPRPGGGYETDVLPAYRYFFPELPKHWLPAWWRHQMETFSAILVLCEGNPPVTGGFPAQRPVTRSFDVFYDLRQPNGCANNRDAGDLRPHRAHYEVTVMCVMSRSYLTCDLMYLIKLSVME